jgi:hypothetical protein
VSFYASTGLSKEQVGGEWRCFVDDEQVGVQQGYVSVLTAAHDSDFYGGWVTANLKGKMKGGEHTPSMRL